jgi:hypothetical protein
MMTPIPKPSEEKMEEAKKYLGKNPVGVIARNRTTYGRNLQPDFYIRLIHLLQDLGYSPIWLGEKQSTLPCPIPGIVDMTRKEEAKDLELTLAIVSQLKFTVQFWTASTRLAALMGTPYILFESPDQLFGSGQESYRLSLVTNGKAKIVLAHFLNVYNDNECGLRLAEKAIREIWKENWDVMVGAMDSPEISYDMVQKNKKRLIFLE